MGPVIFKKNVTVGYFQRGFIINVFLCESVPCWFTNDLCSHFQALLLKWLSLVYIPHSMINALLEKVHNQIVISWKKRNEGESCKKTTVQLHFSFSFLFWFNDFKEERHNCTINQLTFKRAMFYSALHEVCILNFFLF